MEDVFKVALLFTAYDRLTRPMTEMTRQVKRFTNAVQKAAQMGEQLRATGERISLAGALVSGASTQMNSALRGLVGPALEADNAIAKVATMFQATGYNMQQITEATKRVQQAGINWSKAHKDTAQDFINATYMMLSAGLNEKAAIEATKTAMTVATATMGDHIEAANLVAMVYNNMGNKAADAQREMQRIGDVITKTQQLFQIKDLSQLAEGLKYAIPSALQFRMSIEQLNTAVGMLNTSGLQGSMAGTALAASLRQLIRGSEKLGFQIARTADGSLDFIKTLENIRQVYGDLTRLSNEEQQAFQKAFGEEGLRTVILLSNKIEALKKAQQMVANSAGAAAKAQALFESSAAMQLQIMQNNLIAVKMQLATYILPLINKGVSFVVRLTNAIDKFAKSHKFLTKIGVTFFAITAGVLGVLGPLLSLIGGFYMLSGYGLQALAKIGKAFIGFSGRVFEAGSVLGRFYAAIKYRGGILNFLDFQLLRLKYRFWEGVTAIKAWTLAQWSSLRATIAAQGGIIGLSRAFALNMINGIKSAILAMRAFAISLLTSPIGWIGLALAGAAILIYKFWGPIKAFFVGVFAGIKNALAPLAPLFKVVLSPLLLLWRLVKAIGSAIAWLFRPIHASAGALKTLGQVGKIAGQMLVYGLCPVLIPIKLISWGISKLKAHWEVLKKAFAKSLYIAFNLTPLGMAYHAIRALVNFAKSIDLTEAGRKIILTLWHGMKSYIMAPVHAMRWVAHKIRNLLPFSPAKEGPLADLHRVRIIQTIAEAIKPDPLLMRIKHLLQKISAFSAPVQFFKNLAMPAVKAITAPVKFVKEHLSLPKTLSAITAPIRFIKERFDIPRRLADITARVRFIKERLTLPRSLAAITAPVRFDFEKLAMPAVKAITAPISPRPALASAGASIHISFTQHVNIEGKEEKEIAKQIGTVTEEAIKRIIERYFYNKERVSW